MNLVLLSGALALVVDGSIDVKSFRKNATFRSEARNFMADVPAELQKFLKEIGFKPLRDLDRVEISMRQEIENPQTAPMFVVHGNFSPTRIHSSWAKAKKEKNTPVKATKLHGKTILCNQRKSPS